MAINYISQSEEAESKYLYFILGVSAATLGYALEHGQAPACEFKYALYLFAVFAWLLSFYLGVRAVQYRLSTVNLMANAEQLSEGIEMARKNLPSHLLQKLENEYSEAIATSNLALTKQGDKFQNHLAWQFRLIVAGALAYTGWRLMPLAMTVASATTP
jgi:membrane protein required for beta-lactamase induction